MDTITAHLPAQKRLPARPHGQARGFIHLLQVGYAKLLVVYPASNSLSLCFNPQKINKRQMTKAAIPMPNTMSTRTLSRVTRHDDHENNGNSRYGRRTEKQHCDHNQTPHRGAGTLVRVRISNG